MKAELCKTCIHTKVCFHDKNLVGDTFVCSFIDVPKEWEAYKEWEKAGFPCNDYLPASDTVVVVRCKDCKHSDTYPTEADNDMPLKCLGIRYGGVMADWFCEHGERKDGAE